MGQVKNNIYGKKGTHFRWEERLVLQFHREKRNIKSPEKLAELLGKSKRTIQRELRRGWVENMDTFLRKIWVYNPDISQRKAEENYTAKGPNLKLGNDYTLMRSIAGLISKDHYSPDAVIMHFEKNEWPTNTRISTKTLYRYIAEGLIVDVTEKNLLHHGTRSKIAHGRPRRHKRVASARKSISLRPESVETRKDYGHWEMDCVVSGKDKGTDALFVLTERKTRYEIIRKIPDQTANSVVKELNRLEHQFGSRKFRTMFKTITCDNGSEFMDSVGIERSSITKLKRTTVYYAHPYCASERGSNENANSIIRRFIPKGSAIRNSNKKKIKLMQDWMNNYPRRILNGLSAADLQRLNFT